MSRLRYPGQFALPQQDPAPPEQLAQAASGAEFNELPGMRRWLRYTTAYFEDRAVIFGSDFLVHRQRIVRF
ncbi:hypothetical protein [Silvimonas iriomotensis]|uniref:Uncharacterized protein n=1 Tax=Silvimonas iriomotensis TaxID=449662 RepID=A0ABQ2P7Q4_9NEIS|nr:hypothetical protein [Silvimonas iriomotensis]GGP20471.1 hypothetical protein GCM10010970_15370 [Silvimonas iriomotensis]